MQIERTVYTGVAVGQGETYLVRSDGIVDKTKLGGQIGCQMVPPEDAGKYIRASADNSQSYLLTDKGIIVRTKWSGATSRASMIIPPTGHKYVNVSSGPVASYFVLSNGVVMRAKWGGAIESRMVPDTHGVKYIDASAGMSHSYLLRDDGLIDKVKGGSVIATLVPQGSGPKHLQCAARYIGFGQQLTIHNPDGGDKGPWANYLVRNDGIVERVTTGVKHQLISAGHNRNYTAASAGDGASYLIRDDGVCCRARSGGHIQNEMIPARGTRYTQAGAGGWASYILRSDGAVVRTVHDGEVMKVLFPRPRQAKLERFCEA